MMLWIYSGDKEYSKISFHFIIIPLMLFAPLSFLTYMLTLDYCYLVKSLTTPSSSLLLSKYST